MARPNRSNSLALAVLICLYERPMHPYEVSTTLRQRQKHESVRLNYGSLYAVVASLEKRGMIAAKGTERSGRLPERTVYELTDAGRAEAAERAERAGGAPWEGGDDASEFHNLIRAAAQMFAAAKQIARQGDPAQMERATAAIRATGKELYRMLAED